MAARKKKPPKPKKPRVKKPPKPKKVHARHPAAQLGKSTTASDEPKGLTPSGGTAAHDVEASAGLSSVILDLLSSARRTKAVVGWQHGSTAEGRLARGAA
jgi:hypothetical protein